MTGIDIEKLLEDIRQQKDEPAAASQANEGGTD